MMNNLENQFYKNEVNFSERFLNEFVTFEKNNHSRKIYDRYFTLGQESLLLFLKIFYYVIPISYIILFISGQKDLFGSIFLLVIFGLVSLLIYMLNKVSKTKRELYNRKVYDILYAEYFDFADYSNISIEDIRKNNIHLLLEKYDLKKEVGTYNKLHYIMTNIKSRSIRAVSAFSIATLMMTTAIVTIYARMDVSYTTAMYNDDAIYIENNSAYIPIFTAISNIENGKLFAEQTPHIEVDTLIIEGSPIIEEIEHIKDDAQLSEQTHVKVPISATWFTLSAILGYLLIFVLLFLIIKIAVRLYSYSLCKENKNITLNTLEELVIEELNDN